MIGILNDEALEEQVSVHCKPVRGQVEDREGEKETAIPNKRCSKFSKLRLLGQRTRAEGTIPNAAQ